MTVTSGGGMPMPGGPPFFSEPLEGLHAATMAASGRISNRLRMGFTPVLLSMLLSSNMDGTDRQHRLSSPRQRRLKQPSPPRERILQAARELFARDGIRAGGVETIAA